MAKKPSPSEEPDGAQFIVDIGNVPLTDEDVDAVQNQITKVALEFARKKDTESKKAAKEPYVKIVHVKATFVRKIKR